MVQAGVAGLVCPLPSALCPLSASMKCIAAWQRASNKQPLVTHAPNPAGATRVRVCGHSNMPPSRLAVGARQRDCCQRPQVYTCINMSSLDT